MTTINHWHKLAYLYQDQELTLAEITQACVIFTTVGFFGDDLSIDDIGVNVFDNTQLNDALIYGILMAWNKDKAISYKHIGVMLLMHANTIGRAIKRLKKRNYFDKSDYGSAGSLYTLTEFDDDDPASPSLPKWIYLFTQALVELDQDEQLHAGVAEACEQIEFARGMKVFQMELREKFYRRDKPQDK